jgi:hypothetical protein
MSKGKDRILLLMTCQPLSRNYYQEVKGEKVNMSIPLFGGTFKKCKRVLKLFTS